MWLESEVKRQLCVIIHVPQSKLYLLTYYCATPVWLTIDDASMLLSIALRCAINVQANQQRIPTITGCTWITSRRPIQCKLHQPALEFTFDFRGPLCLRVPQCCDL